MYIYIYLYTAFNYCFISYLNGGSLSPEFLSYVFHVSDELRLGVFERKILRRIYGPICEGEIWRSRYNEELYHLYDETDLVTTVRITRLRWAGYIVRMQDNLLCKKITLDKSGGQKASGKAKPQMDGWSDEGCREVGSQNLEDQGQG